MNDTSTSISLRGEGEDCWNSDDFGSDINVSPGSSYMYYSSITAPTLLFDPRSKLLSYDVDGDRPESPRGLAILSGFRCERSSARGTGRYHVHIQRGQRCLPANSFVITR